MSEESDELKTRIALLLEGTPVPWVPTTPDPASQPDRVAEISQETARELMAACIAAREALEYIDQVDVDVFERGWNEEIGQCDAAIAHARAELGGKDG